MEVNRLLGDELSYELTIRGLPSEGTVAEKRSTLRGLLRCERSGFSTNVSNSDLNSESELDICDNKLQQLASDIDNFDLSNRTNEYARIYSRLLHINGRLSRLVNLSVDLNRDKLNLVTRCMQMIDSVENLMESVSPPVAGNAGVGRTNREYSLIDTDNPLLPEPVHDSTRASSSGLHANNNQPSNSSTTSLDDLIELETNRPRVTFNNTPQIISSSPGLTQTNNVSIRDNVTRSVGEIRTPRDVISRQPMNIGTFYEPTYSGKPITISKWNVRFDGKSSIFNFLERIEELRVSRGATKEQLLIASAELFTGDALIWYRSFIKDKVKSWDELVS